MNLRMSKVASTPTGAKADRHHLWYHYALVGYVLTLMSACKPTSRPERNADSSTQSAPVAYWLVNSKLTSSPDGGASYLVQGPTPIHLFPDWRVQSMPDTPIRFDGYLPESDVRHPRRDGGLMLYAHRRANLHIDSPRGPIIGRLHPGAFVSVGAARNDSVAIGGIGLENVKPHTVYVRRDALDFDVVREAPRPHLGKGRSKVTPLAFNFDDPLQGTRIVVEAMECYETWFPLEGNPSQSIGGIEITGASETRDRWKDQPRSYSSTAYCATRAISQHGSRLFLTDPQPGREIEVTEVPPDFLPVEILSPDPLLDALCSGGSVYWMVSDPSSPFCLECTFEQPIRRATVRAESDTGLMRCSSVGRARKTWSYSVAYQRSYANEPAHLHLERLPPFPGSQIPTSDYTLLGREGEALLVTPYRVPEQIVAFHPDQAERWYANEADCERNLLQVAEHLFKSPERSSAVGFHVSDSYGD